MIVKKWSPMRVLGFGVCVDVDAGYVGDIFLHRNGAVSYGPGDLVL